MMANYLRNKIQDYLFYGESFIPPTTYYIALSKTLPSADGTGVSEPVGGNYARIPISRGMTNFSKSVNGVSKNIVPLLSNESTDAWGNLPYYAIFDAPLEEGGNLLYGGTLPNARNIDIEMQLVMEANGLEFELS